MYDTLQSVIRSMPPEPPKPTPIQGKEGGDEDGHVAERKERTDKEEAQAVKERRGAATPPVPIMGSTVSKGERGRGRKEDNVLVSVEGS